MSTLTIARREFVSYFASPVAYVVAVAMMLVLGILFYLNFNTALLQGGGPNMAQWVLAPFVTLVLFLFGSAMTMRLLAEESRTGTMELILTAPVREWELVLGKWLAAFGFFVVILVLSLIFSLIANAYSTPALNWNEILVAYLGVALMTGALLAIGVFASSLFANQIAAFFAAEGIILTLWLAGLPLQNETGWLADFLEYIELPGHYYDSFATGVINLGDTLYFVSIIAFFLFAAARVVESRRWR